MTPSCFSRQDAHWRIQGAAGAKAPPPVQNSTGAAIQITPPPENFTEIGDKNGCWIEKLHISQTNR